MSKHRAGKDSAPKAKAKAKAKAGAMTGEGPLRLPASHGAAAEAALLDRARLLWLAGDWQALTAMAGERGEAPGVSPHMAVLFAAGLLQLGETGEARAWIARAREGGADAAALTRMLISGASNSVGRGFHLLGREDRARAHFDAAAAMGHAGAAIPQLGRLRADEQKRQLDGRRAGDRAARLARQGERLFAAEDWSAAAEAFAAAAELAPDEARHHQWLGEAEARNGRWDPAVRAWREALKRDPQVGVAFYRDLPVKTAQPGPHFVESPVFIVGCGHSGTSIMLAILGNHPAFHPIPKESGLFIKTDAAALKMMAEWDEATAAAGKRRWIEKTPPNIFHIGRFLKMRPQARFVLMLRDGRDVVCSLKHRIGYRSFEDRLDRWIYDNMAGLPWWDHSQVKVVKYEDLIEDPADTLAGICAFLGEEYDAAMLDYHRHDRRWYSEDLRNPGQIVTHNDHNAFRNWQINQPLFDGRGKWREEMSEEDRKIFYESRYVSELMKYISDTDI